MNLSRTTLLLTRPESASRRFAAEVEREVGRFGEVVISPLMEIIPFAADLPRPSETDWVFTSGNAVPLVAACGPVEGAAAWCVGQRTADAASAAGFTVRGVAPDAAALVERMAIERPERTVVHASGRHRRVDLAAELRAAGIDAQTITVYDQRECALSDVAEQVLSRSGDVVVPLFSPRSARLFGATAKGRRARISAVAISPAAAAEWSKAPGEAVAIARTPDAAGVLAAMVSLFDADRSA